MLETNGDSDMIINKDHMHKRIDVIQKRNTIYCSIAPFGKMRRLRELRLVEWSRTARNVSIRQDNARSILGQSARYSALSKLDDIYTSDLFLSRRASPFY